MRSRIFPLTVRLLAVVALLAPLAAVASPAGAAETVVRRAGPDRYSTAVELSKAYFAPGVEAVYVATGESFADALAGVPAAAKDGAPLLLTARSVLPEVTASELERLQPATVVVLGGESAVSDDVLADIEAAAGTDAIRAAGADRTATAAELAQAGWPDGAATVFVANGFRFPDALSGGAAAASVDAPILLVATSAIPPSTADELSRLAPDRIVVLGGTSAVDDEVAAQLEGFAGTVDRIFGDDRFETSAAVADEFFAGVLPRVVLATGIDFPDALAAGAAAASLDAPVLLSARDCIPEPVALLLREREVERLILVGGESVLGPAVEAEESCADLPDPSTFRVHYVHANDVDPVDRVDAIRAEVASFQAWMRRESGDRELRIESTNGQVDVVTIELPFPDDEATFERIGQYFIDEGIRTDTRRVIAFAEGREADAGVCGRGGSGIAIYWNLSCAAPDESTPTSELSVVSAITIHEIFHAMGAVPDCAPNGADGHITNDPDDIMTAVLTTLDVHLDPGNDDYYGHGNEGCLDLEDSPFFAFT